MKRQYLIIVPILLSTVLLPAGPIQAGKLYFNRQKTRTTCCIPKRDYDIVAQKIGVSGFAVADPPVGTVGQRSISFHFRSTGLTVDQLTLDQVGLMIEETTGTLIASGRITNRGADDGLIGNNVTLRFRAFVASSRDPKRIPPDAVVVWTAEEKLWVPVGEPTPVSLRKQFPQSAKSAKFADITHMEVELEYGRDR